MVIAFIDFDDTITVCTRPFYLHKSLVDEMIEEAHNQQILLPFLKNFVKPSKSKRGSIFWNEIMDYLYESGASESWS